MAGAIYVDLDDVLSETARGFMGLLEREFGRRVDFDAIVSFDLGQSFGLSPAETAHFMELAHRDEILLELDPIAGGLEALENWAGCGYRLEVVTGRPPATEAVSRAWLERNSVPYDDLLFLDKYAHSRAASVGPEPVALDDLSPHYVLAVEDSRAMAQFLSASVGLKVALFDRPWNRNGEEALAATVTRCVGWDDLRARFARP